MKNAFGALLALLVEIGYRIAPSVTSHLIRLQSRALDLTSRAVSRLEAIDTNGRGRGGFGVETVEPIDSTSAGKTDRAKLSVFAASYLAAKDSQQRAAPEYAPAEEWKNLLEENWRKYRRAITELDYETLSNRLENFFRNEAIAGIWGGVDPFAEFCKMTKLQRNARAAKMSSRYYAWRESFPSTPLSELDAPAIGNPWGYRVGSALLIEPAFQYHYCANYVHQLIGRLKDPVVLEIGGGFGGLAYYLLKLRPAVKYVCLDLPENVFLQSYYLSTAFPEAKVYCYQGEANISWDEVLANDVILLPNFCLPQIPPSSCDIVVNIRSMGEMPLPTVTEYLQQIDRIGRLWFFHENIYKRRGDGLFGTPATEFPEMQNFVQVACSASRWSRADTADNYPCNENLFIHRSLSPERGA